MILKQFKMFDMQQKHCTQSSLLTAYHYPFSREDCLTLFVETLLFSRFRKSTFQKHNFLILYATSEIIGSQNRQELENFGNALKIREI